MRSIWLHRRLLWELTLRDLRERYIGSAGGWAWLLARPILTAVAYLFVFDYVFRVRPAPASGTATFSVYLLSGLIPFMLFVETINRGAVSLLEAGHLLKKTVLPAQLFPARAVLSGALIYFPVLFIFLIAVSISRGGIGWAIIGLPLWFCVQLVMSYYFALSLSLLTAALRDVEQAVGLVSNVLVFFTPVFFSISQVPQAFQFALWLNPAAPLVEGYHCLLLEGRWPDLSVLFMAGFWIFLAMGIARVLYRRCRDQVVDWL